MKVKRAKANKRAMTLYVQSFGFRKPYQVLVDSEFIQIALDQKIDPVHQIPKILLDTAKQMVSPCTVAKLKSLGDDAFGAFIAAKRLEKRRCPHQTPIDEHECLAQIIGDSNQHRYCVGSQSKIFRAKLRNGVAGVPLLYINRSVLILEPPSDKTMQHVTEVEHEKTHAKATELARLKATTVTKDGKVVVDRKMAEKIEKLHEKKKERREAKKAEIAKKRKKVAKEPNPLSVKKKKQKPTTPATKTTKEGTPTPTPTSTTASSSTTTPAEGSVTATTGGEDAGTKAVGQETKVLTSAEKKKQKKKEAKKLKRKLQKQQQQQQNGGASNAGASDDSDSDSDSS